VTRLNSINVLEQTGFSLFVSQFGELLSKGIAAVATTKGLIMSTLQETPWCGESEALGIRADTNTEIWVVNC